MLNTIAASAVVLGTAALVTSAAPAVVDMVSTTRDAATATSAAVRAVDSLAAPAAFTQREIDPEDPRFGEVIGGTIARTTDAIRGAVRNAESEGYYATTDIRDEDEAVEACAVAAQRDAARSARIVAIDHVGRVDRTRDGWTVDGVVLAREDFRDRRPDRWGFSCRVDQGRVVDVAVDGARDRWAGR